MPLKKSCLTPSHDPLAIHQANMFSQDLENMEGLHHLYEIFRNIFLLNKNALFEIMFSEETIFDVVGCLEFEPGCATPKRHREYLKSMARFHQVVNLKKLTSGQATTMQIIMRVVMATSHSSLIN